MKIKLPKPIMKDPNALDAKSRKSAGPMVNKNKKRVKKKTLEDHLKEYQ